MSGFRTNKTTLIIAVILGVIIVGAAYQVATKPKLHPPLIISTTTSLYETGLLDVLKERFEVDYPETTLLFVSQGTGLAIETAKRGDADMIMVHSPGQELGFMETGYGVNRKIIAYNFFIIVGPESDQAGILGMNPIDALLKVQEEGLNGNALWVSRGDNSGTHSKEKGLWKSTGLNLDELKQQPGVDAGGHWYIEAGAGMTATLQLANEKGAYTLTDVATYLKNHGNGNIELVKIVDSGEETLNVYSAILCNPEVNEQTNYDDAEDFLKYLLTDEVQTLLAGYGIDEFGSTLFKPWMPELDNPESEIVQWVEEYAYFEGTECPTEYRYLSGDLYR
jgi:tungstate transport system substrate-binding protein